ncbi:hypothetical protein N9L85_04495 [Euryarchaeota archaeon]|nr:hypothetical protein [Euryarchaeota archaeon]MDC3236698.1 hypothetical protein [Candidatus Poseidoniaceae archaeon]
MSRFSHWYAVECRSSSYRDQKVSVTGCGHWMPRGMKETISEAYTPQGSPCKACGRRQRLNPGNVIEAPNTKFLPDGSKKLVLTSTDERRKWAHDYARQRNLTNQLSETTPSIESNEVSIERNGGFSTAGIERNDTDGESIDA